MATVRLGGVLTSGRVDPSSLYPQLGFEPPPLDRVSLLDALRRAPDPGAVLDGLEPAGPEYRALEAGLRRYRRLAADPTLAPLAGLPPTLRPGEAWSGVPRLRRLLVALGDLPAEAAAGALDSLYDRGLVEAVRRFQRRHALADDGLIGPVTRRRLGEPLAERVRQLAMALERERWLPRTPPLRRIEVNLAAFRLSALDADRAPPDDRVDMAVVIGEADDHPTPSFTASLRMVVFRPWWEVPISIMRNEIRPAALADTGYLARQGMELWQGSDSVPRTPDNVARIGHGVRVRQRPGPANALGAVKFLLPNRFDVYLHDTPARTLFEMPRRDFSHGCIRVANAVALARFALRDQPEWGEERMAVAMAADQPTEVDLRTPIPVYVLYQTAAAVPGGELHFYPDVYGYDREVDERLHRPFPAARR